MEINKTFPIMFQKKDSFETNDTRFTNVTIWLMHLGENLNGSYFSKEVVTNSLPSLANTPILAYIEKNPNDEIDASDHRQVLVKEDGEFKIKYIGQAYGVIPESCNPRFQTRVCDDSIEREFLVVDGLCWSSKFEDIDTILKRDSIKSQSMELHEDVQGYFDKKDNLYHFTDFKFFGACMLSSFVNPAMHSSTIEVTNFSVDEFTKTVNSKMEEFKQYTISQKGGNLMEDNIIEPVVEQSTDPIQPIEEFATVITTTEDVSKVVTETIDQDSYKVEELKIEKTTIEVVDIQPIDNQPQDAMMTEEFAVEETVVVVEPVIEPIVEPTENFEEKFKELEGKFSQLEIQFNTLVEENNKLKEFKAVKENESLKMSIDEVTSQFALEESEIAELKTKAYAKEISVEEYQEKLFALVGKKNFSKVEKVVVEEVITPLTFSLEATESCPYPSLSKYFQQ